MRHNTLKIIILILLCIIIIQNINTIYTVSNNVIPTPQKLDTVSYNDGLYINTDYKYSIVRFENRISYYRYLPSDCSIDMRLDWKVIRTSGKCDADDTNIIIHIRNLEGE